MPIFDARSLDGETAQDLAWLAAMLQPPAVEPRSTGRRDGVFMPRKPRSRSLAARALDRGRLARLAGNA